MFLVQCIEGIATYISSNSGAELESAGIIIEIHPFGPVHKHFDRHDECDKSHYVAVIFSILLVEVIRIVAYLVKFSLFCCILTIKHPPEARILATLPRPSKIARDGVNDPRSSVAIHQNSTFRKGSTSGPYGQ